MAVNQDFKSSRTKTLNGLKMWKDLTNEYQSIMALSGKSCLKYSKMELPGKINLEKNIEVENNLVLLFSHADTCICCF